MKKVLYLLVVAILFISCNSQKKGITIGICQISNDQVLDVARENVIKALKDAGYEEGKNISIDYKNAQGEISNIFLILKEFKSKNVDLIITNGTPCMASAAQIIKNIPVVYTVSFSPSQIGINNPPSNLCGAYDELDLEGLIKIMKETIPSLKAIGNPYNPAEPNSQYAANKFKTLCEKNGITLIQSAVSSSNDIMMVAQSLTNNNIQAFAVLSDNLVYNGLNSVVTIANSKKIPLFVSEPSQVEKGACIGYGISFVDWGYESGKIAAQILNGKKPNEIGSIAVKKGTIIYNHKAAMIQGYSISDNILKKAIKIF